MVIFAVKVFDSEVEERFELIKFFYFHQWLVQALTAKGLRALVVDS